MGRGSRRRRVSGGAVGVWLSAALVSAGCGGGPAQPTPPEPEPEPELVEFTGEVVEAYPWWDDLRGVSEVTVTLTGGQVDGRTTVTDEEGRFTFGSYLTCVRGTVECRSRRIQVEKPGYETREESLDDLYMESVRPSGVRRRWSYDFRRLVIGHAWPADPQLERLRAEVAAMEPVWLVLWDAERWYPEPGGDRSGSYGLGLLQVRAPAGRPAWRVNNTIAHEYCHAHQDWVIDPDDYSATSSEAWVGTPEGEAFMAARAADLAAGYDESVLNRGTPLEDGAEVCERYYYDLVVPEKGLSYDRAWLRKAAPHQYEWAAAWLSRR